jgi:hypothetical protein
MKDPRVLFRKISLVLPITRFDVLNREIKWLKEQTTEISILDLGAGSATYWKLVLSDFPNANFKLDLMDAASISESNSLLNNVQSSRLQGMIPMDLSTIPDNAYDMVVAFDLIEHLSKDQGYILLYEIDRICSKTSVVFTPNGFIWQPPSVNNSFNAHISGWTPREFRSLGWKKVRGHTGFRNFHGPYGLPKSWLKGGILLELSSLLKIFSWVVPRFAFAFTATKRTKNIRIPEQEF